MSVTQKRARRSEGMYVQRLTGRPLNRLFTGSARAEFPFISCHRRLFPYFPSELDPHPAGAPDVHLAAAGLQIGWIKADGTEVVLIDVMDCRASRPPGA